MKTLEQLGISPAPWKYKQDSGYDRESWDFNTYDAVCDAEGKFMVEWANGESYGEVCPNSEQDARLMAAAPDMYKRGFELVFALEDWMQKYPPSEFSTFGQAYQLLVGAVNNFRSALAKASGESEVKR